MGLLGGKSVRCFPGIESSEPISKVRDWIAGIIETAIHLTNAILKSYYSIQSPYPFTYALYDDVDRKSWRNLLKTPMDCLFKFLLPTRQFSNFIEESKTKYCQFSEMHC